MTHKIKIGNREIKLSEPQKKILEEIHDDGNIIKLESSGLIRYRDKPTGFAYVCLGKERTINSLLNKGVLIQQKTEYGYFKIIKSY